MKCILCGKEMDEKTKIRGGYICGACCSSFPESIRLSIQDFTAKQLGQAQTLYRKPKSKPWIRCGEFGLTKNSVILNRYEYPLRKLRGIRLNFHPRSIGSSQSTAFGTVTLVLETVKPNMVIEEPFLAHAITARYNINGMSITYFFSKDLSRMVQKVKEAIENGTYSLEHFMAEYRAEQERKKQREEQRKQEKQGQPASGSPFDNARSRFGLEMPYSAEQVKKARNKILMKEKIHPDNGGSDEKFKILEEEYQLLLKYAAG